MPEYLHPGVYVEEVSSGIKPIEGVSTSTAGFIGITAKGIPNKATFITSWAQFVRKFGGLISNSYLPYAVQQYFNNGGKRCYVVRVLNEVSAATATVGISDRQSTPSNTLRVNAAGAGAWGDDLTVKVEDSISNPTKEFRLVVYHEGRPVETFDDLSMSPASLNYVETAINGASEYIEVEDLKAYQNDVQAISLSSSHLDPDVIFNPGGETFIIELPDGSSDTRTFTGSTPRNDVVSVLNDHWGAFNVNASLDSSNHLLITHNSPGYENYFGLSGTATALGRPLAGMAGYYAGQGSAVGAVLKSAVGPTFDTSAGNNQLTISIDGDALPTINLTSGAATPIDTILGEISAEIASSANGLISARRQGDRIVISSVNRGANNSSLQITGTADTQLAFLNYDRSSNPTDGQGRSEPAFIQSDVEPFSFEDGASLTIVCNNGTLGADVNVVVTFSSATIPNLQQVSAETVRATIAAAAPAGSVDASVENGRVVVKSANRGNYYTLSVTDGAHSPNIRLKFNAQQTSGYVQGDSTSPYYRPALNFVSGVNEPYELTGGDDGSPVSNFDYIGTADKKNGLRALDAVMDVNFIAIPGNTSPDVIGKAVGYCGTRKDCFFIADSLGKKDKDTALTEPMHVQDFIQNRIPTKNSYGALYYPWLEISDPVGPGKNPRRHVPPSGVVAGLYARTDIARGVWKAAAGTEATIIGALGLEYSVTDAEQDILNPVGVNCIRHFPATGHIIWGARTMATQSDPEWRYIPIRRYAIYLEQSIYRGTQWAVFEPNDETLWAALRANIEDFLMGEFRKGALAGSTPEKAFLVKCDEDLNPESEVAAGRVNMEVAFAPLRPAEFVIIRISQKTQRAEG